MPNKLFYGDNLDNLRKFRDEIVDLCYIDPPFNSKRNYNHIYNNIRNGEDRAQAQAFIDTWEWDDQAIEGFQEIIGNDKGRYTAQTVALIKGLHDVLKEGSLLAYLVSMTRRIVEIYRVLKDTGSFYLHCDPTSSHYLKLILDAVFCAQGGEFQNELIWNYSGWNAQLAGAFNWRHDVILFYAKRPKQHFNSYRLNWGSEEEYLRLRKQKLQVDKDGRKYVLSDAGKGQRVKRYLEEAMAYGQPVDDVWPIDKINNSSKEKLEYPTQKPEALMERIIKASSNEGDLILDAYAGCGTTVAVAQQLNRRWIGMDITYQAISVILKRLETAFGRDVATAVILDGAPKDMESARALAHKKDDRLRKEFEKWAVLTYSMNRARPNDKKGADAGIDGFATFMTSRTENASIVFQVKSGHVGRGDIAKLNSDRRREGAALATLITLEPSTAPMRAEAKAVGKYTYELTGRQWDIIQIVTVQEIIEERKRLELPLIADILKKSPQRADAAEQLELLEVG